MKKDQSPLVSVILPVYNMEKYLHRCMDSILNNSYRNLEIICINDGSKDSSKEILQQYQANDKRVKVINQQNQGVNVARNRGISYAQGEYIALLDSDDWIHPRYFELLLKALQNAGTSVAVCDNRKAYSLESFIDINQDELKTQVYTVEECSSKKNIWNYCWARLYRRAVLDGHSFKQEIKRGEDTIYNLEILCEECNNKVAYVDVPLYYYFQRQDSIVHSNSDRRVVDGVPYLLSRVSETENQVAQRVYLNECSKLLLAYRYLGMFESQANEDRILTDKYFSKVFAINKHKRVLSKKESLTFEMLWKVPLLYRLFRIATDRSLLEWEKEQKNNRRKIR